MTTPVVWPRKETVKLSSDLFSRKSTHLQYLARMSIRRFSSMFQVASFKYWRTSLLEIERSG